MYKELQHRPDARPGRPLVLSQQTSSWRKEPAESQWDRLQGDTKAAGLHVGIKPTRGNLGTQQHWEHKDLQVDLSLVDTAHGSEAAASHVECVRCDPEKIMAN